jgi:alpha-1,2-mannosyltransferase
VLLRGGPLYAMRTTGAHLAFTYPPAAAVLFSWMPDAGLWWAKTASIAFSQCAFVGCVWLTLRWLQVPRRICWGVAGFAAAGLFWLEPVQATLHFGQVNLLLMLLVLADLTRRPRWIPAGVLIGIASGLKLVPAIFIVYLFLAGRTRAALTAVGAFAATIVLGFAVTPVQSADYWTRYALDSGRAGSVAHVSNQSLLGLIARLAGGPANGHDIWLVAAFLVGAGGLCLATLLYRSGRDVTAGLTCACTGLLVSPISWNHHWVWAVPVAVALAHRTWQARDGWAGLALVGWLAVFGSNVIWHVPRSFGREYRWHGWQLVGGNAYVLAGLAALVVLASRLLYERWSSPHRNSSRAGNVALPSRRANSAETPGP